VRVSFDRTSLRLHRELLVAMESVRTRLAVAMAAESKSTTQAAWQYYLETDDQIRRLTKALRGNGGPAVAGSRECLRALESLRQLSAEGNALGLCRELREIVSELG